MCPLANLSAKLGLVPQFPMDPARRRLKRVWDGVEARDVLGKLRLSWAPG